VKLLSEPTVAKTDGSAMLNCIASTVSVDVGKVILDTAELLESEARSNTLIYANCGRTNFVSSHIWTILEALANRGSVRWWSIALDVC
jgi:hypothetical protein